MAYEVKVVVHALDDPQTIRLVGKSVESERILVKEFTVRNAEGGAKEIYIDLQFNELALFGSILGNIEAVKGAAVMAATKPKAVPLSRRLGL